MTNRKRPAAKTKSRSNAAGSTEGNAGELHQTATAPHKRLTNNHGVPLSDNQNSLKAGPRGPSLLEDFDCHSAGRRDCLSISYGELSLFDGVQIGRAHV